MASFKQLKSGWQARIFYYDVNGDRQSISKNGFKTKHLAQEYANELEYQYSQGGDLNNKNVTLIDYLLKWYQTFRKPQISASTKLNYEYTIRIVKDYFGRKLLKSLTRIDYQNFLNQFGNGDATHAAHAKATVIKVNAHIRACVHNAINDGIIFRDFTFGTHIAFDPKLTRKINYLSEAEAKKLLRDLKAHLNGSIVYSMAYAALLTGMRVSEIAGLTWDCIDQDMHTIHIYHAWNFKSHTLGPTKNASSNRTIIFDPALSNLFAHVKLNQNTQLTLKKADNPQNLVFLGRDFEPVSINTLEHLLRISLKRSGINSDLTFHGLRHTHASLLLYKGIAIPYISQRLGHKNVDTTISIYLHIVQELQTKEADKTITYLNKLEQ